MKRIIFSLGVLMVTVASFSQIPRINLSQEHIQAIEQEKSPLRKLNLYHKFYSKDSIRTVKIFESNLEKRSDSISRAMQGLSNDSERTVKRRLVLLKALLANRSASAKRSPNNQIGSAADSMFSPLQFALNPSVQLTARHLKRMNTAATQAQKRTLFERFYRKDSVKTARDFQRNLKRKSDSLSHTGQSIALLARKLAQKSGFNLASSRKLSATAQETQIKSINEVQSPEIVTKGEGLTMNAKNNAGAWAKEINQNDIQNSQYLKNPDSLRKLVQTNEGSKLENKAQSEIMTFMGGAEFKQFQAQMQLMKGEQDRYLSESKQLGDSAAIKRNARQEAEKLSQKYLTDHPQLMNAVQKRMNTLMSKYSSVPNSNDLSTAVKRTSMKGRTFRERLLIASNFQVMHLKPLSIDFSPQVGYKFNSVFAVGLGGTYRQTFVDSLPHFAPQVFGYKIFGTHNIVKDFFAYTEFDRNSTGIKKIEGEKNIRLWQNSWLLGVGKKIRVNSKVDMTIVMLYNVFHKIYDPVYPRPVMVRIGFQLSELAMLKRASGRR